MSRWLFFGTTSTEHKARGWIISIRLVDSRRADVIVSPCGSRSPASPGLTQLNWTRCKIELLDCGFAVCSICRHDVFTKSSQLHAVLWGTASATGGVLQQFAGAGEMALTRA